jgi:hypothetical protein
MEFTPRSPAGSASQAFSFVNIEFRVNHRQTGSNSNIEAILSDNSAPMLRLESTRLHPIPADLHIAPSPRMILARIQKKPSAFRISAFPQQLHLVRSHQLRNAQRKHPQQRLR